MNLLDFDVRNLNDQGRSVSLSTKGMVVSSHHLASSAGVSFLKEGGNAVDAALVMSIVLCMAEPHMTGIGGDCFVLLSPDGKTNNLKVLNASGYAGIEYNVNVLNSKGINNITASMAHSVTIPGALSGWQLLHSRYGKKSWKEIFYFALDYIKDGVLVSERVSVDWLRNKKRLENDTDTKNIFLNQGKPFKFGELFKNPKLIETLRQIADNGTKVFYNGYIGEDICKKLSSLGGLQKLKDLSNYEPQWLSPIKYNYRGVDIYECPPNGQGITVFIILEIMKNFELRKLSQVEYYHLYIEATKIAYLLRDKFIADPNFIKIDFDSLMNKRILKRYIDSLDFRKAIFFNDSDFPDHNDTIYLSVRDQNGMTVSFINSLFDAFGSGITAAETGILLHCRGRSFNLKQSHPNEIKGHKRPLHTIIPGLMGYRNKVIGSFGVMGGHFQAAGHAFILSQMIDFHLNPQHCLNLPRVFPNNGFVEIEEGFDESIIKKLENMGHNINYPVFPIGGGQIILLDSKQNIILGASDARKDGIALGL